MRPDSTPKADAIAEATQRILARCRSLGFALAGVCEALPTSHEREFRTWLDDGKHGEMAYMARHTAAWLDPRELLPGARSIICVADRYPGVESKANVRHHNRANRAKMDAQSGRIARYARGEDYHVVMKKRLHTLCDELRGQFPDHQFRACVDTAPLMEREHAQRAGLGAVGKHTLLIDRDHGHGSWLLLGEIVTTLPLNGSASQTGEDPCGSCTRCIDACPTGAITPWSVNATKCISYLTIEHRSAIDEQFHEAMGDWVFGCDICQEVCPHNQPTRRAKTATAQPAYAPRRSSLRLLDILQWTASDRREAFARSPMKRARLDMMKRNAIIAANNAIARGQGSTELADALKDAAPRHAAHDRDRSPLDR
jgi:epoxyqueuosine reductase